MAGVYKKKQVQKALTTWTGEVRKRKAQRSSSDPKDDRMGESQNPILEKNSSGGPTLALPKCPDKSNEDNLTDANNALTRSFSAESQYCRGV